MPENITKIEITTSTIFKGLLLIVLFALVYVLKDVLIIFLFALIIASALAPFANWLDSRHFPRLLGVLLLYLVVFGTVVVLSSLVVPYLSQEIGQLSVTLPEVINKLSTSLENVQKGSPQYLDFMSEIQNMLEALANYLQQNAQSIVGLVVDVFGGFFTFIAVVIISFYLAVTRKGIQNFLDAIVPEKYEAYIRDLWGRAEIKVGKWLQGQMLLALIVGLVVYVGLSIMDIRFALLLGILAMLLEVIPIVGPVVAAVPAVFFAFIQSPMTGVWVLVFYIIVQQLENHILVPLVFGKTVGLNPVVVIIALLVGQKLAGIPGMILSVPVATIIVEMLEDLVKIKEEQRKVANGESGV
jgi:predicted PurR-regulated permease PerM